MPNAIGTDFKAIQRLVADRTGLPTLGFRTDGIHSYLPGAGGAYVWLAKQFVKPAQTKPERPAKRVNLLGLTPLDFSVVGNATTLKQIVTDAGFTIQSSWSMGDTLDGLATAADAFTWPSTCAIPTEFPMSSASPWVRRARPIGWKP